MGNIRMELQEVGCGYMDWRGLAQARYPLNRRLGKLQSQFGRTGEEENLIRVKKTEKKQEGKREQK